MPSRFNPVSRHRSRCREIRAQMSGYLDGELDPDAALRVKRHVRWCPNCRRMLANLIRTVAGLRLLAEHSALVDDSAGSE